MSDRLENEKRFHDQRFGSDDAARQRVAKYYSIGQLPDEYYKRLVTNLCAGADLLEYGCGTGSSAFYWAEQGANVTGIDLSDEGIKLKSRFFK
jgi:2-polyprenyl-3-methyl-5-hydroxy-6-metoxy-1,4-benzoquinol methylase